MDGLPTSMMPAALGGGSHDRQRTLRTSIDCVGVGLHSGQPARLVLSPAPCDAGVMFRRMDLAGRPTVKARFDHVIDTRLCTVLGNPARPDVRVGTVEHLMAALAGFGIDNAVVDVDGPEVPILDGSAASFAFLIECAGVLDQSHVTPGIEVLRAVRVENGAAFAELRPGVDGLDLAMSIDFEAAAIGRQAMTLRLSNETFLAELAGARTFTLASEVAGLRAAGLARGGSLDNAIVVDGARVLNPAGLRRADEFVRHKMLDAVGDLALAGGRLCARFVGHCSGHALNNRLLRELFSDASNWRTFRADAPWAGYQSLATAA